MKLFLRQQLTNVRNKLERLSLASFSQSNVCELGISLPEWSIVKVLHYRGRLPALPTNIRLYCERLDRDKRSSLKQTFLNYGRKFFVRFASGNTLMEPLPNWIMQDEVMKFAFGHIRVIWSLSSALIGTKFVWCKDILSTCLLGNHFRKALVVT
jgi:hypothetical protein